MDAIRLENINEVHQNSEARQNNKQQFKNIKNIKNNKIYRHRKHNLARHATFPE